jgi:hypothetical protein
MALSFSPDFIRGYFHPSLTRGVDDLTIGRLDNYILKDICD